MSVVNEFAAFAELTECLDHPEVIDRQPSTRNRSGDEHQHHLNRAIQADSGSADSGF